MIQKIKKPVSILLVFMMIVSLFTVVPITASAEAAYTETIKASDCGNWWSDEDGNIEGETSDYEGTYVNVHPNNVGAGSGVILCLDLEPLDFDAEEGRCYIGITAKDDKVITGLKVTVTDISSGEPLIYEGESTDAVTSVSSEYVYVEDYQGPGGDLYGYVYTFTDLNSTSVKIAASDWYLYVTEITVYLDDPAPAPATYTVTWNNWDDTELDTDEVEEGATPTYDGTTPTKAEDENYTYTFAGWSPEITAVTGDVTYTATFEATPKAPATHTHDEITFDAWAATDSLPTDAGNYYLANDVTIASTWTAPAGETNLCLNGHGIKKTGNGNVITVSSGASLTIYDCNSTTTHYYTIASPIGNGAGLATVGESGTAFTGGYITGGKGNDGGGVIVQGTFTMNAGTIIGNNGSATGGGVFVAAGGKFYMNDGALVGNTAQYGGGVGSASGNGITRLVIGGGTVAYNKTTGTGGGVHTNANGRTAGTDGTDLTITGGVEIKNNHTDGVWNNANAGGGVVIDGSGIRFDLSGSPVITGNTAGSAESPNNLFFHDRGNPKVSVSGELTGGASIGVTMRNPGVFTVTSGSYKAIDYKDNFTSDNSDYFVVGSGDQLKIAKKKSTVTWKDYDGTVLKTEELAYGETPEYDGTIADKPEDDEATYTTIWSPDIVPADGDATYTVVYRPTTKRHYKIDVYDVNYDDNRSLANSTSLWYDTTGTNLLQLQEYGYTAVSVTRASGDDILAFSGADITVKGAGTEDIKVFVSSTGYIPLRIIVTPYYNATWKNWDGTIITSNTFLSGTAPVYPGETPTKAEDDLYTYNFAGWTPEVAAVTSDVTYTATFTAIDKYLNGPQPDGYFYLNDVKQLRYQLIKFGDDYFFINDYDKYTKNARLYLSRSYVAGTDLAVGYYDFGDDGKMEIKNGLINDRYYVNGAMITAYRLIEIDGDWYFISDGNKIAKNQRIYLGASYLSGTNFAPGYYDFDAQGRMSAPQKNGADEDGYFYIDGVKQTRYQLIESNGDYYFINDYDKYAKNTKLYLSSTYVGYTGLPAGLYEFGADGKMIIDTLKNGPQDDGYFYIDGARCQKLYRLVEFEGDWYFINDGYKYAKNARLYLSGAFLRGTDFEPGYFVFGADGKLVTA